MISQIVYKQMPSGTQLSFSCVCQLLVLFLLLACRPPARAVMQSHTEEFKDNDSLSIALERSPSAGTDFTFCASPAESSKLNLNNAAWLAYLAANEYSHLNYLSEVLQKLGFQNTDGRGIDWGKCIVELRVMRSFEDKHKSKLRKAFKKGAKTMRKYLAPFSEQGHPEAWKTCARDWYSKNYYDGTQYPSASFEKFIVRTAHKGQNLQFFSGGKVVLAGKAFIHGSTQVMFARHATQPIVIISFRGTEPDEWSDIRADGQLWKTKLAKHGWPAHWGSVHKGFYSAFESVDEVLHAKVSELEGQNVGIWLTGHSLGGALATLMAAALLRQIEDGATYSLKGVYTYGSPRVGNIAFQEHFDAAAKSAGTRVIRFRNENDAVTHIPGLFLGYQHVGTLAFLTENGLEFPEQEPSYPGLGSVGDHNMVGWDKEGKPEPGYYRRILQALALHPPGDPLNDCSTSQR